MLFNGLSWEHCARNIYELLFIQYWIFSSFCSSSNHSLTSLSLLALHELGCSDHHNCRLGRGQAFLQLYNKTYWKYLWIINHKIFMIANNEPSELVLTSFVIFLAHRCSPSRSGSSSFALGSTHMLVRVFQSLRLYRKPPSTL